ncbi:hypothetical protein O181_100961 [Austropuccinia psidii MF-1]|uniref:Integrase catalytic domain-containing protein n=1 Tax=Austropuccinia psidii MF-1 TaxID=1389203 RepID=A0A9Q3PI83_9BASI|nr:hypothetical protein [Austropuccinia psidii MF-1]
MTRVHTHCRKDSELSVVLATGVLNHLFNDRCFFANLKYVTNIPIPTGYRQYTLSATATGTAKVLDLNGAMWKLKDFLYVPGLTANIIVMSQFAEEIKIKRLVKNSEIYLNKEANPAFVCNVTSGILEARIAMSRESKCLNTVNINWHDRLGHMHDQGIKKLLPEFKWDDICNICSMCKFPKLPFQHSFQKTTSLLENIHMDLCRPIPTPSLAGVRYFMNLVDQFSGYFSVKLLKQKSEAFTHFRNFKVYAEKKLNCKILNITSDGGGRFKNSSFKNFTREQGINHVVSPPHMPQHNGIVEQDDWSVIEKTRCLMLQLKLPTQYWEEAEAMATILCNMAKKCNKSPYELWHKIAPPINNLRPFGCKTWVRIPDSARMGNLMQCHGWESCWAM